MSPNSAFIQITKGSMVLTSCRFRDMSLASMNISVFISNVELISYIISEFLNVPLFLHYL
jgi:hypothetical protein